MRNCTDRSAFIPDVYEGRNRFFTPAEILAWVEDAVTVIEHDEQFGTVVDAQPDPRAAVLIDPDSHRQHLLAAHRP